LLAEAKPNYFLAEASFDRRRRRRAEGSPHMLRRACGYALADKSHDTRAIQARLGPRSIISTAACTALAPNRFKDFWRD
jgi:integrase